jgi:hypothetical protein
MGIISKIFKPKVTKSAPNNSNFWLSTFGTNTVIWQRYAENKQNDLLLIEKYNSLGEISAPINKYAITAPQVTIDIFKKIGTRLKPIDETDSFRIEINRFWASYADLLLVYKKLLGNVYINIFEYENPLEGRKLNISLLPSQYVKIVPDQNKNIDIRNIQIKEYMVLIDNDHKELHIPAKSVLHIKESNPKANYQNYLYGFSKLHAVAKNIQSIEAGYGAKVGLYSNGPRGIVTGKTMGEFASANVQTNEDVEAVQKRFNDKYGLQEGQYSWLFTDIPLDVNVISMNIQQLQINENNASDFEKICGALNIDPRAVGSQAGNTFENVRMAYESFLVQSFKSEIDLIVSRLEKKVQEYRPEFILKPNYSNIPEIVKAIRAGDDELLELTKLGLYTRNEYFERIGERTVQDEEFKEYYAYYNGVWTNVNKPIGEPIEPIQDNNGDGQDQNN